MNEIFVNLKRFEVPKRLGGLCPLDSPVEWIESVIGESVESGLGSQEELRLTFLLPEALIAPAIQKLKMLPKPASRMIEIGCQGVHWEDIAPAGNFGAFTASFPATAARTLGCSWAIIGHSEERKSKLQVMQAFQPSIRVSGEDRGRAARAVDRLTHDEVHCALDAGLNVLLCVGETADERGDGPFEQQEPRIERVLEAQLLGGLTGVQQTLADREVVIGYEPIWAIGPGKVPPGKVYISFVSGLIKRLVEEHLGFDPVVVYGGGLKEDNAGMIASVDTIGGGLIALTRFTGDIGFDVRGLQSIVAKYLSQA
jgi:triosephosphate isomerase